MMSRRRSDNGEGDGEEAEERFADLVRDVKPLAQRSKIGASHGSPPARRPAATATSATTRFEFPDASEACLGTSVGLDRSVLRRLRSGGIRPESQVDLHGQDAATARRNVRQAVLDARDAGMRCVLVIHGRGRHSEAGPILREALPGWLAEAPLGPFVLAFTPALPNDGGNGACYVLLRRRRESS